MKKILSSVVLGAVISVADVLASLAAPSPCATAACTHAAPAPEIGTGAIGMAMAVMVAVFLKRRRKGN